MAVKVRSKAVYLKFWDKLDSVSISSCRSLYLKKHKISFEINLQLNVSKKQFSFKISSCSSLYLSKKNAQGTCSSMFLKKQFSFKISSCSSLYLSKKKTRKAQGTKSYLARLGSNDRYKDENHIRQASGLMATGRTRSISGAPLSNQKLQQGTFMIISV